MFQFIKKWFKPSRTDEPTAAPAPANNPGKPVDEFVQEAAEPVEQAAPAPKFNNVSVDGLSAERNVIATIMKRTNAPTRDAVRETIKSVLTCKRDGCKGRYYNMSQRSQAIKLCYDKFGKRIKENGTNQI